MRKIVLMLVIAITSITVGSCTTTETRYQSDPLPLPARPVLPKIAPEQLLSIPDDVLWKIFERNRLRREYAEKLEVIIKSTHKTDLQE